MAPGRSGLVKLNGMSRSNFIVFIVFLSLSQYQFVLKEIGGKTSYKFSYLTRHCYVTQQELIIPVWRKLLNYLDCAQHEEKFNVNQPVIFWLLPRLGRVNFRPLTSSLPPRNHLSHWHWSLEVRANGNGCQRRMKESYIIRELKIFQSIECHESGPGESNKK